jgi:hypothetical protein
MIRSTIVRVINILLIPVFLTFVLPDTCAAQSTTTTDSSGDSGTEELTIALFAVIVGVLVWVGWKYDRESRGATLNQNIQTCPKNTARIRPFVLENRKSFSSIRSAEDDAVTELANRVGIGIQVPF